MRVAEETHDLELRPAPSRELDGLRNLGERRERLKAVGRDRVDETEAAAHYAHRTKFG